MVFEYKGLKIKFHPLVYEPAEDTFLLAKHLENLKLPSNAEILEIGSGTGIVALLLAKKTKHVIATDINQYALNVGRENAELNKISNVDFVLSDLFDKIDKKKKFDLIVFNTPYLPTEKAERRDDELEKALDGGKYGRETIDKFIKEAIKRLKLKGKIVMVESTLSDHEKTLDFFKNNRFAAKVVAWEKFDFEEIVVIQAEK